MKYKSQVKDSSRWVVTLIRGLYKPHIGPLPLYEPYISLIWGYPPGNYPPETVPDQDYVETVYPGSWTDSGGYTHAGPCFVHSFLSLKKPSA